MKGSDRVNVEIRREVGCLFDVHVLRVDGGRREEERSKREAVGKSRQVVALLAAAVLPPTHSDNRHQDTHATLTLAHATQHSSFGARPRLQYKKSGQNQNGASLPTLRFVTAAPPPPARERQHGKPFTCLKQAPARFLAHCNQARGHGERPRSAGGGGGERQRRRQAGERSIACVCGAPPKRQPFKPTSRPPPHLRLTHHQQDDKTSADYYFDSYSHFGERREREERFFKPRAPPRRPPALAEKKLENETLKRHATRNLNKIATPPTPQNRHPRGDAQGHRAHPLLHERHPQQPPPFQGQDGAGRWMRHGDPLPVCGKGGRRARRRHRVLFDRRAGAPDRQGQRVRGRGDHRARQGRGGAHFGFLPRPAPRARCRLAQKRNETGKKKDTRLLPHLSPPAPRPPLPDKNKQTNRSPSRPTSTRSTSSSPSGWATPSCTSRCSTPSWRPATAGCGPGGGSTRTARAFGSPRSRTPSTSRRRSTFGTTC